jgi:hypothetical protein
MENRLLKFITGHNSTKSKSSETKLNLLSTVIIQESYTSNFSWIFIQCGKRSGKIIFEIHQGTYFNQK